MSSDEAKPKPMDPLKPSEEHEGSPGYFRKPEAPRPVPLEEH